MVSNIGHISRGTSCGLTKLGPYSLQFQTTGVHRPLYLRMQLRPLSRPQ